MNEEGEARQKALLAGVKESDITPEILEYFGFEGIDKENPLRNIPCDPKYTRSEMEQSLILLYEEARRNQWGTQAMEMIGKLLVNFKRVAFKKE